MLIMLLPDNSHITHYEPAPADFSGISLNAVNYAADMAMALNANLLVLHAIELPINANELYGEPDAAEIEAGQKLNDLKENLVQKINNKVLVQTKQVVGLIERDNKNVRL